MMKAFIVLLVVFGGLQSASSENECEAEVIEMCQKAQKSLYEKLANEQEEEVLKQLYCANSQALIDCLVEDPKCKGDEINKYRYTSLEYNVMNVLTKLCPRLDLKRLTELVPEELRKEHEDIDDLDGDEGSQYATEIHWQCVKGLIYNMHDPDVKLCAAVETFRECYDDAMSVMDKGSESTKLLAHFHHILTHLNQEVLSDVEGRDELGC